MTKKCDACNKATASSPVEAYGFCGYACMEQAKPGAFAADGTDHDAVIPATESPADFTARLLGQIQKED